MPQIFVKPKAGLIIPDPETGKDLPPEGAAVEDAAYWRRLKREGDVLSTTEAEIAAAKAEAEKAAKPSRKTKE